MLDKVDVDGGSTVNRAHARTDVNSAMSRIDKG